jgi:hypothetical protein
MTFMTAPPNYLWQQLLERTFPAYPSTAEQQGYQRSKDDIEMKAGGGDDSLLGDANQPAAAKPNISIRNTVTKWFVDCITLGAIMNTIAFFIIMGLMKGQDAATIGSNIQTVRIQASVISPQALTLD